MKITKSELKELINEEMLRGLDSVVVNKLNDMVANIVKTRKYDRRGAIELIKRVINKLEI
jgi:hypothetical protein